MNVEQLAAWLEQHLPQLSGLNVNSNSIKVAHVLNWGGFVNHSFSVDGGSACYHLKITDDRDSVRKLRAWYRIHALLEDRYRAPKIIQWMDLPEIGFAGLLFDHIAGSTVNFCEHPVLLRELIELAEHLHRDADLQSHFNAAASAKTYLDHFVETYMERFTADLELISRARPPFVSSALLEWMWQETDHLRDTAGSVQAFHHRAIAPVHGDLNEGNVLVGPNGWFVLDWDDLAIGDPAVEFAVLLWPVIYQGRHWNEFPIPIENGLAERIEVCCRAQLLDEVIDPLADYVAADAVPSRKAEVQGVKRKRHEEALARYTQLRSGLPRLGNRKP